MYNRNIGRKTKKSIKIINKKPIGRRKNKIFLEKSIVMKDELKKVSLKKSPEFITRYKVSVL